MDGPTLGTDAGSVLDAIASAPRAWATLADIAELATLPPDAIPAILDDLTQSGLVEGWPAKEAWTLTPLSAERLGLRLGAGPLGVMSWVSSQAREPRRRPNVVEADRHEHLIQSLPDRRSPFDLNLAFPTLILTGSATVWTEKPGRIAGKKAPKKAHRYQCQACHGARLAPNAVCLRCQNWGLDHRLRRQQRTEVIHKIMTAREQARAKRSNAKHNAIRNRDVKIILALQNGSTTYEVASMFGVSQSTVSRAEDRLRRASNLVTQAADVA